MDGAVDLVFPDTLFQFGLHALHVQVHPIEQVDDGTVLAAKHTQQQMLRAYAPAGKTGSLLAGES